MNSMLPLVVILLAFAVLTGLQVFSSRRHAASADKELKGFFLLGLSGLMAKLAQADGKVTDDEVEQALGYFDKMGLTDAERALCVGNFVSARRDGLSAREHARRFMSYANPTACEFLYSMLWRLSTADGVLDPAEDKLLSDLAQYLELGQPTYTHFKAGDRPSYDRRVLRKCGVPTSLLSLA